MNSSGVDRIAAAFESAAARGGAALIPYLCAGDPDRATSAALIAAVRNGGADLIELGIPYGDPLADGPTIAAAAQRALGAGMTLENALELARQANSDGAPPMVAFCYFNPIVQYGIERFAETLAGAGVSGAIVPDAPLEELGDLRKAFAPRGLALPLLVAPTTPPARATLLAAASDGFVYVVSRLGVTGARREPDLLWLARRLAELRAVTTKPLAVGFGVATAAHVRAIAAFADGVIVGSALIDAYAGTGGEVAVQRVRALMGPLDAARLGAKEPAPGEGSGRTRS